MKNRNSILVIIISLGISSPVNAYFTDNQSKMNEMTPGNNQIMIVEEFPGLTPIPTDRDTDITKTVCIFSSDDPDNVDCYIRVRVTESSSDIGDAIRYENLDISNWEYHESEDFYYYKWIVSPGEYTTPLFTGLRFTGEQNSDKVCSSDHLSIDVYAESIQAAGSQNYLEAWDFGRSDEIK